MKKGVDNIISVGLLSVLLLALTFALGGCGPTNQSPAARIATSPPAQDGKVAVQVGEEITFDGSNSEPNGGEIAEYAWDFKSNSSEEASATGETEPYTYETPGTFTVTLTVTDDGGLTDTASVEVEVEEALNAEIDLTSPSDPDSVTTGDTVTFDGSNSAGDVASYDWDFKSSSDPGTATDTGVTGSYTYQNPGTYTVELVVTGGSGATDSATYALEVSSSTQNEPPTAEITADKTSGTSPLEVNFDGSGSSDPDGSIQSYLWEFGDGEDSTEVSPTHTFTNDQDYTVEYDVTLTVTDDDGATGTEELTIAVLVPPPPP